MRSPSKKTLLAKLKSKCAEAFKRPEIEEGKSNEDFEEKKEIIYQDVLINRLGERFLTYPRAAAKSGSQVEESKMKRHPYSRESKGELATQG